MSSLTVADIGEHAIIARVRDGLDGTSPATLVVGVGDDAAIIEPDRGKLLVLTTDALVEGVHFDHAFCPMRAIGHKALAANLSDVAAMGATPRYALLSLALPPSLAITALDQLVAGFSALATRHATAVVGGNITTSPGPLFVDVTAVGSVKRRRALTRAGARPGDILYMSGVVGAAAAGLGLLRAGTPPVADIDKQDGTPARDLDRCRDRYLYPEPRLRLGMHLAHHGAARSCIDLSDGLADGARQLASASGTGVVVDAAAIPVAPGARMWFGQQGVDPVTAALAGGEDYELLFTSPPGMRRRVDAARRRSGKPILTPIGYVTKETDCVLRRDGHDEPLPAGYEHFRR